jgi:hypothetical protein
LGYSPKKNFFLKIKTKIIKAGNVEKVGREIKLQFLEEIQDLVAPPLCPKLEGKKCKFKVKLNDYWINLHKN